MRLFSFFRRSDPPDPQAADALSPFVILGLGNPGEQYAKNRHNIGGQCVALFARQHGLRLDNTWRLTRAAQGTVAGRPVVLARSRTFMNESGLAASALLRRTKAPADHLIVLCDDLDLPLGTTRLRERGSTGGHKGLNSVAQHLGTQEFPRLRIGIGRPDRPIESTSRSRQAYEEEVMRWVLSEFTHEEEETAQTIRERAGEALLCIMTDGITVAMNRYN